MGRLVLLSDMTPTTTCAEKIHESAIPIMAIVQRETLVRVDGVLVDSICRTSSISTRNWAADAKAASAMMISLETSQNVGRATYS